jgi:hypothetical protein
MAVAGHRSVNAGGLPVRTRWLLDSLKAPVLAPFLAHWPAETPALDAGAGGPALPVLAWLPRCAADPRCLDPTLVAELCAAAPRLAWRQSYGPAEVGAAFLKNYGWTEFLGVPHTEISSAPRKEYLEASGTEFSSTSGEGSPARIACGVLLLGPATLYPPHSHPAEEIYVPLSGTADWLQGDGVWRPRPPGSLIHHRGQETHAMRSNDEPLLALYLWRGADMSAARLDLRRAG